MSAFHDLFDEENETHGGLQTIQVTSSSFSISETSQESSDQKSRTLFVVSFNL